jgi:hypothetical protein
MDAKLKSRIIGCLRKLTYSFKPRQEALNRQKVYAATFQCQCCNGVVYTGSKKVLDEDLTKLYPHVTIGKVSVDHIEPVVDPTSGFQGWDIYITRMFPEASGWQVLCDPCHDNKTKTESEIRKQRKKNEKKVKERN